jgi:hypothetical protein
MGLYLNDHILYTYLKLLAFTIVFLYYCHFLQGEESSYVVKNTDNLLVYIGL